MTEYLLTIGILAAINVILAVSFNVVLGYGGLASIAHPIFYAIGAYSSALLARDAGVAVPAAILAGAAVAAVLSAGLSMPALRVRGDYLVIASIGVQLGILHIISNVEATGATGGLSNIPPAFVGPDRSLLGFLGVAAAAAACVAVVRWLMHGDSRRLVTAMRNDEDALAALGRSPIGLKVTVFALGSGMAGLAGGLYAHHFLFLTPEQFGVFTSSALLTMVVIGGAATSYGPVLGALLLTAMPELVRFLAFPISVMAPLQGVVSTALVLAFLFFRPQGLVGGTHAEGGLGAWSARRGGRRGAPGAGAR